jgi:hypothetical protein
LSETLEAVKKLVTAGQVRISEHGYDEIAADGIYVRDILVGVDKAAVVEDYPTFPKGRSVLVLQWDKDARPIHVVWGIPRGFTSPAGDRLSPQSRPMGQYLHQEKRQR